MLNPTLKAFVRAKYFSTYLQNLINDAFVTIGAF